MPPEPVERRLERALGILMDYAGVGRVPVEELTRRFACTRRELARDLEQLESCGIPPYQYPDQFITAYLDDESDTVEILVPYDFSRRARLTGGEGVALLTAAATVRALRPDDAALASAVARVAEQLGIEGDLQIELDRPDALEAVLVAQDGCRVVEGRYWSAHRDAIADRVLEPMAVFYGGGAWYVRCRDQVDGKLKLFRLDRFESLEVTTETFEPAELPESLALFHPGAHAESVTVRFPADASWVTESLEVRVVSQDDEGTTATLQVVGTAWLENLLLRTGGRVLDPPDHVGLGADAARRALARYGQA